MKQIIENYFAAAESDEIAHVLMEKVEEWVNTIENSVNFQRMRKSHQMYYGLTKYGNAASSEIRHAGADGEYSLMTVNHYRNLIQHVHVLTTGQRPAAKCKAANSDFESIAQCILGDGLIDFYNRRKRVERYLRLAAERSLALSEGFVHLNWEPTAGRPYGVNEEGRMIYEGDIELAHLGPFDVVRDLNLRDGKLPWAIVIRWKNKYNLAAKYPEKADEIVGLEPKLLWEFRNRFLTSRLKPDYDLVPEFTFLHEKCEAMPQGRMVQFLSGDIKLLDTALPYKNVHVYRITPSDEFDTPWGYTPAFDLLGPQDALNLLHSVILTNQKTFGVGSIIVPQGANISHEQLADGLAVISANEKNGQVRPLNLTATPAEIFNYKDSLQKDMETLMAVNSTLRGNPDANVESGAFAALLAAQAIQFNSGLQASYAALAEDVYTGIIEMLQVFAKTERVAEIIGEHNDYLQKSFTANDLDKILRVTVDVANPLQDTVAGRMKMAEDLNAAGMLKRPEQYIQVYTSGKLDPVVENEQTALMLIKNENEMLRKGQKPIILKTDEHLNHIKEHRSVLDTQQARGNIAVVEAVTAHIQEHIDMLAMLDPNFLMALGQQPMGMAQPMMPDQGMNQGVAPSANLTEDALAAAQPGLPNLPTNPLTGEQFNSVNGGM